MSNLNFLEGYDVNVAEAPIHGGGVVVADLSFNNNPRKSFDADILSSGCRGDDGVQEKSFWPLDGKIQGALDPNGPLMLILIGSLLGSPINKGCIHHQATKLAINLPLLVSHYRPLAHSPLRFIDPARSSVKWGQIEYLVASLVCLSNTTWSRAPEIWCHS